MPCKLLVAWMHSGTIHFCKMFHLKCLTVFWIRLCLDNCSVTCIVAVRYNVPYASDIFRTLAYSGLYLFRYTQTYSKIFSTIRTYWRILRQCQGIFKVIQAHSAPFVTLAYSQPCQIPSPGMFKTIGIFKTLWNFDQTYSERCHSHNGQDGLFR